MSAKLVVFIWATLCLFLSIWTVADMTFEGYGWEYDNEYSGSPVHPLALANIGTADGVTFYAESSGQMNWAAAVGHCAVNGLQLASIKTANQRDTINQGLVNASLGTRAFWTNAMMSRLPDMFLFNGAPINDSLFRWTFPEGAANYCVAFHATNGTEQPRLQATICSVTNTTYPLCQTPV